MLDEYSGEVPFAFIVLEERAAKRLEKDPKEAQKLKTLISKVIDLVRWSILRIDLPLQHVSDAKVQYKWLKGGIEFVDTIPKNPSGKLLRRFLRTRAREIKEKENAKAKL